MMKQKTQLKRFDRTDRQRSKRKVETRLHLLKRKIPPLKRLLLKRGRNRRLRIKVHRGVTDHHHRQGAESIEEDLPEDIRDHGVLVLHQEGEEYRGLLEDTTDTRYPEAEVDRGMTVMDHGVDHRLCLDAEDLTLEEDQDHPGGKETDEKDQGNAAEAVVGPEADLDDPP